MTNLAQSYPLYQVSEEGNSQLPVYASAAIYMGAMVCALTASGYAVRAGTASTGPVLGIAAADAPIPTASGDYNVNIKQGRFWRPNHGSHTCTIADFGKAVYASDDNTISNTSSDGPIAGICWGVDDTLGVLVEIGTAAVLSMAGTTLSVDVPLMAAILAAGTPMAAFADNAASNPGVSLVNSKAVGIRWNNAASQVAIYSRFTLPLDCDTGRACTLKVLASKTGATSGDATTFTVGLFNNVAAALHDADTDYGGATSAMTGTATAKTIQEVTLAVAAADLPTAGSTITFSIKPTDGTLGTDDVVVHGVRLEYKRKPLNS